ncbi:HotDog domain-containing protein [Hypoxylon sp. FL1150]|nr:HotDog domain-containing protein [Hypoxylon sp. FL1150]
MQKDGILHHSAFVAEPGAISGPDSDDRLPSKESILAQEAYPVHLELYTLSSSLCGVPRRVHGGVICLLFDGATAMAAIAHQDPDDSRATAYTNVRFLKPVMIGEDGTATVLIKCQISRRRPAGRKIIVLASMEGPDGSLYATAESLIIEMKARNAKM